MGLDTLPNRSPGEIITNDSDNVFNRVLQGDMVGRDASGAATPGQNLGTPSIPWGTGRLNNLVLGGLPIEPGLIAAQPNRVISGAIRATSEFPNYLAAAGVAGGASFTVLGLIVTLTIDVNGSTVEITTDEVKSGLTLAPGSNNTCQVNDTDLTGAEDESRFLGENGSGIPVDGMGSELTTEIGQFVALLNQATSEIIYCRIASATRLDYARRGFFFDSSGDPVPADVLTNNDTLQILSLAFIFAEDDGSTIDVTYRNPTISGNQPTGPQTGDYWYDLAVNVWKRYSGSSFDQIDRTFIGAAVLNTADCIGTRPEYFSKTFKDDNTLKLLFDTTDIIVSETPNFVVSVDGADRRFDFGFFRWNASTDFESGFSRTASRNYWLYLTEDGKPQISGYKPYDVSGFLRGWYHPYESWRAVGQVYNNGSNEFELVNDSDTHLEEIEGFLLLPTAKDAAIVCNVADPVNDIDFGVRTMIFDDNTGEARINQALTKRLDAAWSEGDGGGMLDTGSKTTDETYHLFAIYSPKLKKIDYIASLTLSPSMPTGYTKKERVWSIITDDGTGVDPNGDIVLMNKFGKLCRYKVRILDSTTHIVGTVGVPLSLTLPSDIQTIVMLNVKWRMTGATIRGLLLTALDEDNDTPSIFRNTALSAADHHQDIEIFIKSNTSSQIRERSTFTGSPTQYLVWTLGYIDQTLRG